MNIETHTLPNGLRIIHKQEDSGICYCGVGINIGTRDEKEEEQGMAHFVEHMLFKGTKKRKAWHILNRLESVGGEINAYTTKEETFVYSTVLKEDAERAIELMADIIFNSSFPQKEMEKEIDIIIDEINSYKDSPSELIFDDFEELVFDGYSIGRNILGKEELLTKYNTQDILNFVRNNYHTTEMVFFSSGNIKFSTMVSWCEKHFGHILYSTKNAIRENPINYFPQKKAQKKDTHQAHYMIGNRAYTIFEEEKKLQLYLLNNILGGPGMNSLLNLALRERNGLVYNVESNFTSYSDTGIWSVYLGCDLKNLKKCEKLVQNELNKLINEKISDNQLFKYKKQIKGQMAISSENKENLILSIGKSFLHYNKVDSLEEIYAQINNIKAEDLQEIANEIFAPEKLSTLIYS